MGQSVKLAPQELYSSAFGGTLLYHQWRTWEALQNHTCVLNTYNTGAGKTRASLLHLFGLKRQNALVIAPTNALIEQHVKDIQEFVGEHKLDFKVLPARAQDIRNLESGLRPGETLHRLIQNYQEFEENASRRQPTILVTNPDIFYYALYFRYNPHDRRNLFGSFLERFHYLIIDEFHYYDNKQVASFLFAMMIFKKFGYLDQGRRICLLSATPRPNVSRYLQKLFGDQLQIISPHNESAESDSFETLPALSPLELSIQAKDLLSWLQNEGDTLTEWLGNGQDGAIISNSLARINEAYQHLQKSFRPNIGRITGPEPVEARQQATARQLILATPTVDIGYNFDKLEKKRQNIDFIISEARFQDELIQRIGRAGRILGKPNQNQVSQAIVLLPEQAYQEFRELNGQTISRQDFAVWLQQREQLQMKYQLEAYLKYYALPELAFPLYQLGQMMTDELQTELDAVYDDMANLLDIERPSSRRFLSYKFQTQDRRDRWLQSAKVSPRTAPQGTATFMADLLEWLEPAAGRPNPNDLEAYVRPYWADAEKRQQLLAFIQSQQALDQAIFNFRDSFQGPKAVIFDPDRLFSSETVNSYEVFHFLRNYQFTMLERTKFLSLVNTSAPMGDFYLRLEKRLETPVKLSFTLTLQQSEETFLRQKYLRRPTALLGYGISGGNGTWEVSQWLAQKPLVGMILPPKDARIIRSRFWGTELIAQALRINFGDGHLKDDYRLFLGTSAFTAHAELLPYFRSQDRQATDAIII